MLTCHTMNIVYMVYFFTLCIFLYTVYISIHSVYLPFLWKQCTHALFIATVVPIWKPPRRTNCGIHLGNGENITADRSAWRSLVWFDMANTKQTRNFEAPKRRSNFPYAWQKPWCLRPAFSQRSFAGVKHTFFLVSNWSTQPPPKAFQNWQVSRWSSLVTPVKRWCSS